MPTRLLLLLYLIGHVCAKKPPDVDCLVVNLRYVHCTWNQQGTPGVNYTFSSRFKIHGQIKECATYLSENGINTGCNQPYVNRTSRFNTFQAILAHGNDSHVTELELKSKVKLNPPFNLTVKIGSDSNLWFYWNQTDSGCVESDLRYRINNKNWDVTIVSLGRQSYCINLPSNRSLYELQVRSKLGSACGESDFWSDWSKPAVWGSNNSTDTKQANGSASVWTPVLYVVGSLILILLLMMLLHHERLRIILIPVVPKPSLISHDIQDWLQLSKGLKESFKANYNERACPVREYCQVPQSNSQSSDGSASSVATDQTDCSVSIPAEKSDPPTPDSSFTSTGVSSEEEEQVFV